MSTLSSTSSTPASKLEEPPAKTMGGSLGTPSRSSKRSASPITSSPSPAPPAKKPPSPSVSESSFASSIGGTCKPDIIATMDSMTVQGDKHRIGLLVGEVKRFASSASVATRDDKYREGAPQLALYMSALWELCRTWAGILVINDCYSRSLVLGEADYKALDTTPFHGDAILSDGDLPPLIISLRGPRRSSRTWVNTNGQLFLRATTRGPSARPYLSAHT